MLSFAKKRGDLHKNKFNAVGDSNRNRSSWNYYWSNYYTLSLSVLLQLKFGSAVTERREEPGTLRRMTCVHRNSKV